GFTHVLMSGLEPSLLISYALIFIGVDVGCGSPAAAAVAVYAVDLVLTAARRHLGERNVAEKTAVDGKFLV
ncbi:hypothetical protein HK405_007444, partial [Cladochytrium tenue]